MDKTLFEKWKSRLPENPKIDIVTLAHVLPYFLRSRALDEKLEIHEIGRIFFHLGQRRGFLSNRKTKVDEKEDSIVKSAISELERDIAANGSRTLGEYFSTLNPCEEKIRCRYTHRDMFVDEFNKIFSAQQKFYPDLLTADLKKRLAKTLFFQRPLKIPRDRIGFCEFEERYRRMPLADLEYQRFRFLQQINNIDIHDKVTGELFHLDTEKKKILAIKLDADGDLTFANAKKLIGLDPKRHKFNLEDMDIKKIVGNRTAAKLVKIFGDERWQGFSDAQKKQIVEDLRSIVKTETLLKKARGKYGLDEEASVAFADTVLEPGYGRLSRKAVRKLTPLLENGAHYATAVKEVYGDKTIRNVFDELPPVHAAVQYLNNPLVARTLTELRKVVNAVVNKYGKPDIVRIELARDMKKSRKDRQRITQEISGRRKTREKAAEEIVAKSCVRNPTRNDIEKLLLADECKWICPYTGDNFSMSDMFGPDAKMDVEHIIPFSRSLDNSFLNKTLCHRDENRNVKKNKTPWEAYGGTPKFDEIIARVSGFNGDAVQAKLRRFMLKNTDELDDFSSRMLNDTRYASKLACEYLGLLFGGVIDRNHKRVVQATTGVVTAYVRNVYELNSILNDGGTKSRDDHRHHAVDAVAIGFSDAATVKRLSDASQNAVFGTRVTFEKIPPPWQTFKQDVRDAIDNIVTSHRVNKKISGPLHKETLYGKVRKDEKGKTYTHTRKLLSALSMKDIEKVVDAKIRQTIMTKLDDLGEKDPSRAFKDPQNLPHIVTKNGGLIPIRKVRIREGVTLMSIGCGPRERNVITKNNHHAVIIKKYDTTWIDKPVTLFEALQRKQKKLPIVEKKHAEGDFLFSITQGEILEMDTTHHGRKLFVIKSISKNDIECAGINDARDKKTIKSSKARARCTCKKLSEKNAKKMIVNILGEVHRAND